MAIQIILSEECGIGRTVIYSTKMAHNLEQDGFVVVCQMRFAMIRYCAMTILECLLLKPPMEIEIK